MARETAVGFTEGEDLISVLVVEDAPEKAAKIKGVIEGCIAHARLRIRSATNVYQAGEILRTTVFDLMIVDVMLPLREDCDPAGDGGIRLMQELRKKGHDYNVPKHIIGLTAYPAIQTRWKAKFERELWHLVVFDHASDDWAESLRLKLSHIADSKGERKTLAATSPEAVNAHLEYTALPEYIALSASYRGVLGQKVFWLALVTLAPLALTLKLPKVGIELSPATAIYVSYHILGIFVWFRVQQSDYQRLPLAAAKEQLGALLRTHTWAVRPLGWCVIFLILLTALTKISLVFGDAKIGPLYFPTWIHAFLGTIYPSEHPAGNW